jgi:excinuclease UvrABC nuclease subunit
MSSSRGLPSTAQKPRRRKSRVRSRDDRSRLVEKAIQSIAEKLESKDMKATFGDFIRLLQLQKELQIDQPREIKITWVESTETESATEE